MIMKCKTCGNIVDTLAGYECIPCYNISHAAWQKKMAIRQDPSQFNVDRLVRLLLTQHWMHECEIVPNYMPPYPSADTVPTCKVRYTRENEEASYLRYSKGPLQGYFWDVYGDDMHDPECALIALSQAPAPSRVNVIPTHGR